MLKDYAIGIEMLINSLENLSEALQKEEVENSANYFMQTMSYFQMYSTVLGKSLETRVNLKKNEDFPEYFEEDDDEDEEDE